MSVVRPGWTPRGASDSRVTDRSAAVLARTVRGDLVDAGGMIDTEGAVYCGVHLGRAYAQNGGW